MANIVTGVRILCSIVLIFVSAFSPSFYILYLLAGFSDMIDGTIARKTNTASEFGSKLDTTADMIFLFVCCAKILPVINIPVWLIVWTGVIFVIKVSNIIYSFIVHNELVAEHTILNKITGGMLFILPLTLDFIGIDYIGGLICFMATLAALQEAKITKRGIKNEENIDNK